MTDLVSFLKEEPKLERLKRTLLLQKGTKFKTALNTIQTLSIDYSHFLICIDNENNQIYFCPPLEDQEINHLQSSNYFILTYFKGNK